MNYSRLSSLAIVLVVLVLGLAACGGGGGGGDAAPSPDAPPADAGNASISGTVTVADTDDPDIEIKMDADPVCAGLHEESIESMSLVTDANGALTDAFVYVKSGLSGSFPVPPDAAVLSQKGCIYVPHVSGVVVGQTLKVVNNDPTLHNVHASPNVNAEFNQAQPFQDMELERQFDQAEVMIPFKCDVHPWMSSYLGVLEHPFFAVTGADGSFSIEGLPAGDYTVEVWHEVLGTLEAEASVEADGSATVDFGYGA